MLNILEQRKKHDNNDFMITEEKSDFRLMKIFLYACLIYDRFLFSKELNLECFSVFMF